MRVTYLFGKHYPHIFVQINIYYINQQVLIIACRFAKCTCNSNVNLIVRTVGHAPPGGNHEIDTCDAATALFFVPWMIAASLWSTSNIQTEFSS